MFTLSNLSNVCHINFDMNICYRATICIFLFVFTKLLFDWLGGNVVCVNLMGSLSDPFFFCLHVQITWGMGIWLKGQRLWNLWIYKTLIVYTHNKSSWYSFILGYPLSSVKFISSNLYNCMNWKSLVGCVSWRDYFGVFTFINERIVFNHLDNV